MKQVATAFFRASFTPSSRSWKRLGCWPQPRFCLMLASLVLAAFGVDAVLALNRIRGACFLWIRRLNIGALPHSAYCWALPCWR